MGGPGKTADAPHQGGLSTAVRANQPIDHSFFESNTDIVQDDILSVLFCQIIYLNQLISPRFRNSGIIHVPDEDQHDSRQEKGEAQKP